MQTGYILFSFIFAILFEGCCATDHRRKRRGLQQNSSQLHYRAVEGEAFMVPCSVSDSQRGQWSRAGEGRRTIQCGEEFPAEQTLSGVYRSLSGSELCLQVLKKDSLEECLRADIKSGTTRLQMAVLGEILCPGLNCTGDKDVTWYKGDSTVPGHRTSVCKKNNGHLYLCEVREHDTGVYFCDRRIIEQGVNRTFRRSVKVRAVVHLTPIDPPTIMYPKNSTIEEVELGQSHTLTCEVSFPRDDQIMRVQWFMHYGGNVETRPTPLHKKSSQTEIVAYTCKVTQGTIIEEVTPQHLNNTYTCIATNEVGNTSVTIRLKKKSKVTWPSLTGYPIASLLLVVGLGIVVHRKWLEIRLVYRTHFRHGHHDGAEKEFDVFLSYVWSPSSEEAGGVFTISSPSGPDPDQEVCLPSMDPWDSEEDKDPERPFELLLTNVLEDQWGYCLCLLERDVLPGGAYTNDVVLAIQRSRMLICVLSAEYLSNCNAVFVLESGVQALLQNSSLKLLLIWTSRPPAPLTQPDPPLPALVRRALKVVPSLEWTGGTPSKGTRDFWRSLRKAMPEHRQ